ncbi:MAG: cell envelope integrity protein TolA, partial [Thiothrix sp.]|nr:cell envelope integrity protein TolA [Thiothrix sp.]
AETARLKAGRDRQRARDLAEWQQAEEKRLAQQQAAADRARAARERQRQQALQSSGQSSAADSRALERAALAWGENIKARVSANWIEPADTFGMRAIVTLKVRPPGMIERLRVSDCNGTPQFCDSLIAALRKSEPYPRPDTAELYNQTLRLIFEP